MGAQQKKWIDSGLVPVSGCEAWHSVVVGETGDNIIYDYSGNGRTAVCTAGANAPVVQANILNGEPAIYFDRAAGRLPLKYTGAVSAKHVFCLASYQDATFANFDGILTGISTTPLLIGNSGTNKFFHITDNNPYNFFHNSAVKSSGDETAPVSGKFALSEQIFTNSLTLTGLQIGQDRADTTRKWKGWFAESIVFSRILTERERLGVYLYFNLKYALFNLGVNSLPLYFPSPSVTGFLYSRFQDAPPDYSKITDSVEYDDGGRDFNQFALIPPLKWELEFNNRVLSQVFIYDQFWKIARIVKKFNFLDKYNQPWANVQIESYDRNHEAHKSWKKSSRFNLVKYP